VQSAECREQRAECRVQSAEKRTDRDRQSPDIDRQCFPVPFSSREITEREITEREITEEREQSAVYRAQCIENRERERHRQRGVFSVTFFVERD
jgi:hypothetical protein